MLPKINLDGVWNLVLACKNCNRGVAGKFEQIPTLTLLERLHARNNFFIDSHHPLRETLMAQTGKKEKDRISFLQSVYNLVQPLIYVPFFNRVSGVGGFMFRAWWGRIYWADGTFVGEQWV